MLEVVDLDVRFGPIRAVKGISLSVADAEMVALLGANGAGKSSTLLAIAGALHHTAGRITLGERTCRICPRSAWLARDWPWCRRRATCSPI